MNSSCMLIRGVNGAKEHQEHLPLCIRKSNFFNWGTNSSYMYNPRCSWCNVSYGILYMYIWFSFSVPASVEQVENKNVTEGDNVEEYCNVTTGIPDPTVMWTNVTSGEHIKGNPLNITNINRAQAGEYRCTANNTCGVDSTVTNINVQCKNTIRSFYMNF